jgi:hypothetical protein
MSARDKFFTICNHRLPSKAQAKDDRPNGQRTDLIYTKLATFPSRGKKQHFEGFSYCLPDLPKISGRFFFVRS